jgi:hypothetical protein
LEDKDLEGLAELEDEEDEAFLEQYRYVSCRAGCGMLGGVSLPIATVRGARGRQDRQGGRGKAVRPPSPEK